MCWQPKPNQAATEPVDLTLSLSITPAFRDRISYSDEVSPDGVLKPAHAVKAGPVSIVEPQVAPRSKPVGPALRQVALKPYRSGQAGLHPAAFWQFVPREPLCGRAEVEVSLPRYCRRALPSACKVLTWLKRSSHTARRPWTAKSRCFKSSGWRPWL